MGMYRSREVLGTRAHLDRQRRLSRQLGDQRPNEMHAHDRVLTTVHDKTRESFRGAERRGSARRTQGKLGDGDVHSELASGVLGQSDGGDLGIGEHHGGYDRRVELTTQTRERRHGNFSFGDRLVSEGRPGSDIANRRDTRRGETARVNLYGPVGGQARSRLFESDVGGSRPTANRQHDALARDASFHAVRAHHAATGVEPDRFGVQ